MSHVVTVSVCSIIPNICKICQAFITKPNAAKTTCMKSIEKDKDLASESCQWRDFLYLNNTLGANLVMDLSILMYQIRCWLLGYTPRWVSHQLKTRPSGYPSTIQWHQNDARPALSNSWSPWKSTRSFQDDPKIMNLWWIIWKSHVLEGFHHSKPLVPFLLVPQEDVEGLAIFGAEWGRTGTELKVHPDCWLNYNNVTNDR